MRSSTPRQSRPLLVLSRLGILCAALACSPPPEPAAVVRIGVIGPFSGPLAENTGRPVEEAARLAVEEVNAAGGLVVGGRLHQVVLIFEDNKNRPDLAVDAARKLINRDDVTALMGPCLSHNAIAAAVVAEKHGVPMISPMASHREVTAGRRSVFRVAALDEWQARALARFAVEELGAGTAATLYDVTAAYSRDVAEIFQRAFQESGREIVAVETYTPGEMDFRASLARIRDAAPDVLLLPNYSHEVPLQVRQARELGLDATLLGSDAWDGNLFARLAEFEGTFYADSWSSHLAAPEARSFVESYRRSFGRDPVSGAALTYDAFGLLFQAIAGQERLDAEAIRQALAGVHGYHGVTGSISYRGGGDPVRDIVITQITGGTEVFHRRMRHD